MSEQERASRRETLERLRESGVDPYPARVGAHASIAAVREEFDAKSVEELEEANETRAVVGRVVAIRAFGKLRFWRVVENGVAIQVSVNKRDVDEGLFEFSKQIDVGDFVRVEGGVWRTRTDELTVAAVQLDLLSKSLRPLPEKWHGLVDVEARFRQRYLDLLVNERSREIALTSSRAITALRGALERRDFLEVETPVLQPIYGGAAARPFTTHHNANDQTLYLRISDELYLKRLVVGGLDRVYEIGHNFRNEGISRKHSPEFTMMECYQAYADYRDMMDLAQAVIQEIARDVCGGTKITFQEREIELGGEWPRRSMRDAIAEATGIDILAQGDHASLRDAARAKGHPVAAPTWATAVDELFSETVEPTLTQPTFITDYPVELSPLAKRSPEDPRLVERFELFLAGMEIANAFSELNDPIDQRGRFEEQIRAAKAGDEEAHPMDEDYLTALEHGLPPTGGLGLGVGRLIMVLADAPSLREVQLFPHLRPEQ